MCKLHRYASRETICVCVRLQVERSVGLLHSLGHERKRWEASSETFKSQMATIVGDVLLSSAFMAYAGMIGFYLDHIIYGFMCCR
jgi:dynein heavy chain 1